MKALFLENVNNANLHQRKVKATENWSRIFRVRGHFKARYSQWVGFNVFSWIVTLLLKLYWTLISSKWIADFLISILPLYGIRNGHYVGYIERYIERTMNFNQGYHVIRPASILLPLCILCSPSLNKKFLLFYAITPF